MTRDYLMRRVWGIFFSSRFYGIYNEPSLPWVLQYIYFSSLAQLRFKSFISFNTICLQYIAVLMYAELNGSVSIDEIGGEVKDEPKN